MSKRAERRQQREKRKRQSLYLSIALIALVVVVAVGLVLLQSSSLGGQSAPRVLASEDQVQRITPADSKAMLDAGDALLFDTRSRGAYDTSHAAGALSLPEEEAEALIGTVPRDKDIILYCT